MVAVFFCVRTSSHSATKFHHQSSAHTYIFKHNGIDGVIVCVSTRETSRELQHIVMSQRMNAIIQTRARDCVHVLNA